MAPRQNQFYQRNGYDELVACSVDVATVTGVRDVGDPIRGGRAINGDHAANEETAVEKNGSVAQEVDLDLSKQMEQVTVSGSTDAPLSDESEPIVRNGTAVDSTA
ncbi:hypothetical protein FGIG_00225 [Fasciola gigantica]|uniref:Uncharacterized protein n=1 Tax=Fasciola gigantica TaxID=46835 RepID=A0A504YRT0_FASGI|nr:hypothetical protein FGIG_00225 [Fasciola gigantica]